MRIATTVVALLAIAGTVPAASQDAGRVEIRTVVEKEEVVVNEDGLRETRLVPADKVIPGDEVVYTVAYANIGDQPAENVVITNPLPAELSYVEGSASGRKADIQFSVDGGQTYGRPDDLSVSERGIARPARGEDFTHIRWVVAGAMQPGEEGIARFRARLN